jgi:type I restriction enzyme, S subunit
MRGEWRHTTLGKVVSLQRGHDLTEPERRSGTVPVMGSAGENGRHDTAMAKGPGIVIGRSGASFGQVHFCPVDYWPHNTVLYVTNFHGNEPRFVYYFLKAIDFARYNSGSAQPSLNRNFVYPIEVDIPGINEQRAIAHILGTLDDKIELNRRVNETLETIARAIFKSWFVDFDPVRAKASGEPPKSICHRLGLTPDLLALFPDRFVDSELCEIPEGWEIKPLDDIASHLNGLALQKFPPESESAWLPVIKIAQLKSGNTVGADRASHRLNPDYVIDDGDVLFSWSGSLEVDIWCGGRGALNQHLFKVTSTRYPKWFFFHWIRHHLPYFRAIAAGKAVTMGHIQRRHLTEALCAVPQDSLLDRADSIIAPILKHEIDNRKQSQILGACPRISIPKSYPAI